MKLCTFVVPAYNSQAYLDICLSSFLVGEALKDIEVIVVNDGSTDGTSEIAHGYEEKYQAVFRVIDKENGGHGSAINAAMELASGRYFKVIDSDDRIERENLPDFLDALRCTDADVIVNAFETVDVRTGATALCAPCMDGLSGSFAVERLTEVLPQIGSCCTFHGISYRTAMLRDSGYRLLEHAYYEDHEYATVYFAYAARLLVLPFVLYKYSVGEAGQSISMNSQVRHMDDLRAVTDRLLSFRAKREPMNGSLEDYFAYKTAAVASSYLATALVRNSDRRGGRELADEFCRYLSECWPVLMSRISSRRRLLTVMNRALPKVLCSLLFALPVRTLFSRHK